MRPTPALWWGFVVLFLTTLLFAHHNPSLFQDALKTARSLSKDHAERSQHHTAQAAIQLEREKLSHSLLKERLRVAETAIHSSSTTLRNASEVFLLSFLGGQVRGA